MSGLKLTPDLGRNRKTRRSLSMRAQRGCRNKRFPRVPAGPPGPRGTDLLDDENSLNLFFVSPGLAHNRRNATRLRPVFLKGFAGRIRLLSGFGAVDELLGVVDQAVELSLPVDLLRPAASTDPAACSKVARAHPPSSG